MRTFRPPATIFAAAAVAAAGPGAAAAYQWPVKPFNVQHAVRGNFDDPRALRGYIDLTGFNPLSFHSGIDIQAPDGTPVYAIESGQVSFPAPSAVAVASPTVSPFAPLVFGYWHVVPVVASDEYVRQGQLIGYVRLGAGHVHLSEIHFGRYVSPLRRGGIAPYRDRTAPVIRKLVFFRCGTETELSGPTIAGCVDVAVDAYDPPPIAPRPPWSDIILSPTRITWSGLFTDGWQPIGFRRRSVNFDELLRIPLTDVYAPGTRMNGPNVPGDYRFWLAQDVDTTLIPNGLHKLTVTAGDVRYNRTTTALPFIVAN